MRHRRACIAAFMVTWLISACQRAPTVAPIPHVAIAMTPLPKATGSPTIAPVPEATVPPQKPAVSPSPTLEIVLPPTIQVEPTYTRAPGETRLGVDELAVGQPGHYVNVALGYWLQYPPSWYTRFGNRPILVSLSNLDPGTHNRESMRAQGCLIEINAWVSAYGLTISDLRSQIPRAFPGAEAFELDGAPALRARVSGAGSFDSETIHVEHGERLFTITAEFAPVAAENCRSGWEDMLQSWEWFEPAFAVYRNPSYGYSIAAPRKWYRSNLGEEGLWISSQDPDKATDATALMEQGMLAMTDVHENPGRVPLKEWVATQEWDIDLTNDIPLDGLIGVRAIGQGPVAGVQRMSGYFHGPLGRIYEIACFYPETRQWEFRPIANAIIYSFGF